MAVYNSLKRKSFKISFLKNHFNKYKERSSKRNSQSINIFPKQ